MTIQNKILTWLEDHSLWDRWSGTHAIVGAFLAWALAFFFPAATVLLVVLAIAIAWEIYEIKVDGIKRTYGTVLRWFANTMSDVFYAILMACFVVST